MLLLGPALVLLATGLISFVLYVGVNDVLPLYGSPYGFIRLSSTIFTAFLGFNILYNYFHCVMTNPGTHDSKYFKMLVKDAVLSGDLPPEVLDDSEAPATKGENTGGGDADDSKPLLSATVPNADIRNRLANENSHAGDAMDDADHENSRSYIINDDRARSTIALPSENPYAWGHCKKSNGPKPPRAHYDRVTRKLVLNMDHYCPWVFNVVGWRNYRYFFLFLLWLWTGTVFAILMTLLPFLTISRPGARYKYGFPNIPKQHRSNISMMFIICVSIAVAVSFLFFWHVYLVLSGQTTIEFHINRSKKHQNSAHGKLFFNPFDLGYKKNWQHVMGTSHFFISILPSNREPVGLPWPSLKVKVNRQGKSKNLDKKSVVHV